MEVGLRTYNGPVLGHTWIGEMCFLRLNIDKGEREIEVPAWLLTSFDITVGHEWSVLCSNRNVAQRFHNLTTGERRGYKEQQKE